MTAVLDRRCNLLAFCPSSGIGMYLQENALHEFDLVTEDDQVFTVSVASLAEPLATFSSREELLGFATAEYLRDKKQTYYSTLLTEELEEALRDDVLQFLNDPELVPINIMPAFLAAVCDIGRPLLASGALHRATRLQLLNVLQCLRTQFGSLLGPSWLLEGFPPSTGQPVPLRPPPSILRSDRPRVVAPRWVGLHALVPARNPDTPDYVHALMAGEVPVTEHFLAHFARLLQRLVVPDLAYMAEDVVQEALWETLQAVRKRKVVDEWRLTAFTTKVLKNVMHNARRKENVYVGLGERLLVPIDESVDALVLEATSPRPTPVPLETSVVLHDLMDRLWDRHPQAATVLTLRINGWRMDQIARELRISTEAARARLTLARRRLREQFPPDTPPLKLKR